MVTILKTVFKIKPELAQWFRAKMNEATSLVLYSPPTIAGSSWSKCDTTDNGSLFYQCKHCKIALMVRILKTVLKIKPK